MEKNLSPERKRCKSTDTCMKNFYTLVFILSFLLIQSLQSIFPNPTSSGPLPAASATRVPPFSDQGILKTLALPSRQYHKGPEVYSQNIPSNGFVEYYKTQFLQKESRDWIQRALDRGKPYLNYIAEEALRQDVPLELMYLPVIESAFVPYARSWADAVGLWQFIASSSTPYGIRINEWLDERRDFWKATSGAMEKLKYNYRILEDWYLALGAYNCGLGRMSRTMRDSGIGDFWTLSENRLLPRETIGYVPKFLAILELCMYPGRNGLEISWERGTNWTKVPLKGIVDLRYLAKEAGTDYSLLKMGNAELRYHITPPDGTSYFLKVPQKEADKIVKTLENENVQLMKVHIHTIKSGDTLSHLAQHFGVSVGMIQQYNPGLRPRALQLGMKLVIPNIKDVGPYRRVVKQSPPPPPPTAQGKLYTVQEGDTLWLISKKFESSPDYIASANNISLSDIILPGQVLLIPRELAKERLKSGL